MYRFNLVLSSELMAQFNDKASAGRRTLDNILNPYGVALIPADQQAANHFHLAVHGESGPTDIDAETGRELVKALAALPGVERAYEKRPFGPCG